MVTLKYVRNSDGTDIYIYVYIYTYIYMCAYIYIFKTDFKEDANNFKEWVSFCQIEKREDSSGAGDKMFQGYRDLMLVLYQGTASAQ